MEPESDHSEIGDFVDYYNKGRRALLQRAIYMPALVATRRHPGLKAKYDQLIRRS
jgi:hypothetical protein